MIRGLRQFWLLAVMATALLTYASVQSVTMQAVMAAGHDMPGMVHAAPAEPPPSAEHDPHAHHHVDGMDMSSMEMSGHAAHMAAMAGQAGDVMPEASGKAPAQAADDPCAFCQAAAHAPLISVAAPLVLPSAVAYLPPLPAETPRAPGLWRDQPKARGPPLFA
jgi:hypothetical protein